MYNLLCPVTIATPRNCFHIGTGNLNLNSQAVVTHSWLQNKLLYVSFDLRAVVLCQQFHSAGAANQDTESDTDGSVLTTACLVSFLLHSVRKWCVV